MKSSVALAIELVLILIYLALVIFVVDKSNMVGLIIIGVLTIVIFSIVLVLEKKREAQNKSVDIGQAPPVQPNTTVATGQPIQTTMPKQEQPTQPQNPPIQ
tara:strand:- start:947 stop:1249 length:303 start_codon:yes stop_codon:yes gene_type:complete